MLTATGWVCECGRGNMSFTCPRCGAKRPESAPSTPASALPRSAWRPEGAPAPKPAPAPKAPTRSFGPPSPAPEPKGSFWGDLRFAFAAPLSSMGAVVMGVGVVLALAIIATLFGSFAMPVYTMPTAIIIGVTFFWFYNNYFFKTIRVASLGGSELPDSPSGYEAMSVFELIWVSIVMYLALALPNIAVLVLSCFSERVAEHQTILSALANIWPGVAGPMTILLVTTTHNPMTAFNYPAIAGSIVRTFGRYFHVMDLFFLMSVLPQVLLVVMVVKLGASLGTLLLVVAAQAALAMYSMMVLGLYLGRFYHREKARLGWFAR
jgi:hypothetical protein